MRNLIVVDDPEEWPIKIKGVELCSARDYLTQDEFRKSRNIKVFNLCKSYRYQSFGYYVSLLASARAHKPIPNVSTIQDLKSQSLVRFVSEELEELIQKSLEGLKSKEFVLSIYFGHNTAKRYDRLSSHLFKLFQCPLLRAEFEFTNKWQIRSIKPLSALEISENHYPFVISFAKRFFQDRSILLKKEIIYNFDLAILVNHEEKLPPSNAEALKRFIKAAHLEGMSAELITKDDFGRLAEFDALFIRETTAVNHHTYRFARRAKAEGLVVIDEPDSILKCSNKIYLAELLENHRIRVPKTLIVHKQNVKQVQATIGFPCILKEPDSAFSIGVKKASNTSELVDRLEDMWQKSDLVIAQEFLPTDFDWRIGIIDKTPIFACKYHMAKDHWQIRKTQGAKADALYGRVESFMLSEVPEEVINTALKAANLIGNSLYGVDIKEKNDKCYVIEINDNPNIDFGYEDEELKMKLYITIMQVFRDRIEKRKFKNQSNS
jgi:glutathione synthase/RimK-type ligase-like ATP-grasp enzyme